MQPRTLPEQLAVHAGYMDQLQYLIAKGPTEAEEKAASLRLFKSQSEEERPYQLIKTVAVIPLRGFLFKRGWWWGCSYDHFSDLVRIAGEDFAVDTILIDCETPGGGVYGCADCSDVLYQVAKKKRVITCVNDLCASAGLWVGSAATEIVISQSGDIGSLGVYRVRTDYTRALKKEGVSVEIFRAGERKAWGHPALPLTDAERKVAQADVDLSHEAFINAVARNRRVSADHVRSEWGDAQVFTGQQAVDVGLADRVASFDQVLAELVGRPVITGEDDGQSGTESEQFSQARRWVGSVRRRG